MSEIKRRLLAAGMLDLVELIAARHHVTLDAMLGRRRYGLYADARAEGVAVVHWTLASSQHMTGWLFGLDPSTVHHHLRQRERENAIALGLEPRMQPKRARKTPRRTTVLRLVAG